MRDLLTTSSLTQEEVGVLSIHSTATLSPIVSIQAEADIQHTVRATATSDRSACSAIEDKRLTWSNTPITNRQPSKSTAKVCRTLLQPSAERPSMLHPYWRSKTAEMNSKMLRRPRLEHLYRGHGRQRRHKVHVAHLVDTQ